jgi:hypothetical protein
VSMRVVHSRKNDLCYSTRRQYSNILQALCQCVIVFYHLKVSVEISGVWQCIISIDVRR